MQDQEKVEPKHQEKIQSIFVKHLLLNLHCSYRYLTHILSVLIMETVYFSFSLVFKTKHSKEKGGNTKVLLELSAQWPVCG